MNYDINIFHHVWNEINLSLRHLIRVGVPTKLTKIKQLFRDYLSQQIFSWQIAFI